MKKIYLVTLIMSIGISVFAQSNAQKNGVEKQNKELFEEINSGKQNLFKNKKFKNVQQFLLDSTKVAEFVGEENVSNIHSVYEQMRKNNKQMRKNNKQIWYKTKDSLIVGPTFEQKGEMQSNGNFAKANRCSSWSTINKVQTTATNGDTSDATFKVTFYWTAFFEKNQPDKFKKAELNKIIKVVDITAQVAKEKAIAAEKAAKELAASQIAHWQENLTENLQKKGFTSLKPVNKEKVKIGGDNLIGTTYTRTDFVEMYVEHDYDNPKNPNYPNDARWFYDTEPEDHYFLAMDFTVKLKDDMKSISSFDVQCTKGEIVPAQISEKKIQLKQAAHAFAQKFAHTLTTYAVNSSKEAKAELEGMFFNPKAAKVIQVSYLSKKGKESVRERNVVDYLSKLKADNMNIDIDNKHEFGENMETDTVTFKQRFSSPSYSDYTEKELHLRYDNGAYVIEKITVIKGSTHF